jgi:hypothetical protein
MKTARQPFDVRKIASFKTHITTKADYASFRFANFNLVHFNQTRLVESEFFEVTWKKLLLEACDLTEINGLFRGDFKT